MNKIVMMLLIIASLVLSYPFTACKKIEEVKETESSALVDKDVPTNLSQLKNLNISKADYLAYTIEQRKDYWLDKLDHLLNDSNLNGTQEGLIQDLKDEIEAFANGEFELNQNLKDIATDLVDEFSEEDFIASFAMLGANTLSSSNTPTCSWCKSDISTNATVSDPGGTLPDCNCRWSCGDPLASSSCSQRVSPDCCRPCICGCGFLFLQTCTGRDEL